MQDIIFLDKDGTLGEFSSGAPGLFPNVRAFLENQKQKQRYLYVTTIANHKSRSHLVDIEDLLSGYFGGDTIGVDGSGLYVLPDGQIRRIDEDYLKRREFESEDRQQALWAEADERSNRLDSLRYGTNERRILEQEINDFFDYWTELFHKETRELFDRSTTYQNPYMSGGLPHKDLFLARRLISPTDYTGLRTVMVGDGGDIRVVGCDPETPLIVISNEVREGNWSLVSNILDHLFSDQSKKPFVMYDSLFAQGANSGEKVALTISGSEYSLENSRRGERIVHCYKDPV